MNFSNEMHVDTVHVFRRYVVELLYALSWESLAWDTMCSPVIQRGPFQLLEKKTEKYVYLVGYNINNCAIHSQRWSKRSF